MDAYVGIPTKVNIPVIDTVPSNRQLHLVLKNLWVHLVI